MKSTFASLLLLFSYSLAFSQSNADFNGKPIRNINIKTSRIFPAIVRRKFLIHEGDVFFEDNYDTARQALHDMRVFKSIDFHIAENDDGSLSVDINANDGYYVFPLILGAGGSKNTFAAAITEANLFKTGEMLITFGSFSNDGFSTMAGLAINDNFFSITYSAMKFEESVYKNGSYSTSGMFTAEPDKNQIGNPINKYDVKNNAWGLSWSRTFYEKASFVVEFNTSDIEYEGKNDVPNDNGKHNKLVLGVKSFKNMISGGDSGFGALFGIGLSDVDEKLSNLSKKKFGYFAGLTYESGGSYTGSDYSISKINLKLSGNVEFKSRNILVIDTAAAKDFEAPFNAKIRSGNVLSRKGIYSREFRGDEAVGIGTSFIWHPIKNKTGVLSIIPFIENAIVWKNGSPQNQDGAGMGIFYQLWRIPFPIGLKYTQILNDGSIDISFVFGGGF